MGVRKRKVSDVYDYDDLLPTLPTSAYSGGYPTAGSSSGSYPASGSSTNPIVLDAPSLPTPTMVSKPPPAKRQRKQKDPNAPVPEKRGAILKKQCPQNIIQRVERVREQRMFLLDRTRNGNELKEEFVVQGSTGNVYTVVIDKKPSCDCPDALKGNHCKHILFIFLKVLQVAQSSIYWYQKALLSSELEDIFAHAPLAPAAVASERVRAAYAKAIGKASSSQVPEGKKRMPAKDDDCPVCYESMYNVKESTLTFCDTCGNGLHKECFQQWVKAARGSATCVFCRASVTSATSASGSSRVKTGTQSSEGYINLANEAGVSPVRDTSSYYHGPRRGNRYYGYQSYDDDFYF
ncbi:hypothetical protein EUX98_g6263 [Antrodiella citrinella]|uniref:SWIM-type domain-containing protein n=1 Tax=Antrodiella citrinella TaxID=2447956 RepID=A0A4S4MPD6_9APHY|nr:hypothetical protein EUX98_g6263 [Antrodiella citrinella]